MKYDSVIFDIDGTMWDITGHVAKTYSILSELSPYGKRKFTAAQMKKELGKPIGVIIRDIFPELKAQEEDVLLPAEKRQEARDILSAIETKGICLQQSLIRKEGAGPFDGVTETLRRLSEKMPLFIVSNCQQGYIETFMDVTGTRELFTGWVCFNDTGLEKDRNLKLIKDKYALKSTCYVGDILNDAICSEKAGMDFIWASYGFGSVAEEHYVRKIDDFRELTDFIIG